MTIDKKLENNTLTFTLKGRLATATSPQLQDVLIPAFDEAKEIILDFTGIAYVSSAGLRVLLIGQKAAQAKEATMKIRGVPDEIMEVFEMTGFSNILTFE